MEQASKNGFSLQELILVVALVGVTANFSIPKLIATFGSQELDAKRQASLQHLAESLRLADSQIGLLPEYYGPASVLKQHSNQVTIKATNNDAIGVCPTGRQMGESTFQMVNGVVVTNVSPNWLRDSDRNPLNGNTPGDMVCVALKGENSKEMGRDAMWVYLPREGNNPIPFNSDQFGGLQQQPHTYTVGVVANQPQSYRQGQAAAPSAFANSPVGSGGNGGGSPVMPGGNAPGNIPGLEQGGFNPLQPIKAAFLSHLNTKREAMGWRIESYTQDKGMDQLYTDIRSSVRGFFGDKYENTVNEVRDYKSQNIVMYDESGNELLDLGWDKFAANLTVRGQSWTDIKASFVKTSSWGANYLADLVKRFGKTTSHDYLAYKAFVFDLYTNQGANALEDECIEYTDPATGKKYVMQAGFFSPVKVALDGRNAELNSDNRFAFDVDGFANDLHASLAGFGKIDSPFSNTGIIRTAGGLNGNEAWLATDRSGNGFFKSGILDGEDVFGDHQGRFANGYQDLATLYARQIQVDENGKRYIALEKMNENQKRVIAFVRQMGVKQFNASYDLKLITRDGQVMDAADVLTKVYIDYENVNEVDAKGQNKIAQRATVEYINGHTALSADQWFKSAN